MIAFAADEGIYRVRPPFGDPERLSGDEGAEQLAWSPDGTKIAFDHSEEASPQMEIVLLDVVTRKQIGPTRRAQSGFAATWSPDGQQLAFLHGAGELWTMNADGKYPRRLAKNDFASLSWGATFRAGRARW